MIEGEIFYICYHYVLSAWATLWETVTTTGTVKMEDFVKETKTVTTTEVLILNLVRKEETEIIMETAPVVRSQNIINNYSLVYAVFIRKMLNVSL